MQLRTDTAPQLGRRILKVTTDAHNEIGEDWTQFRDGAAILAVFSLLVLGLLHLAMARISGPLRKLTTGFEAVGTGDYGTHVALQGPKEISVPGGSLQPHDSAAKAAGRRQSAPHGSDAGHPREEERADLARDLHE